MHGCCQYDRIAKLMLKQRLLQKNIAITKTIQQYQKFKNKPTKSSIRQLFCCKRCFGKTDGNTASTKATELLSAINAVKMETLTTDEHTVWMKVLKTLKKMLNIFQTPKMQDIKETISQRYQKHLRVNQSF